MLSKQIKLAKKALRGWPKWMRKLAYFEGGDRSGLNTLGGLRRKESAQRRGNVL